MEQDNPLLLSADPSVDRPQQAIVIGASMTGLLAARILADHFPQVTVVERDSLPPGPTPRAGVPQARHVHILLMRGQRILERRFPDILEELGSAGAPMLCVTTDFAVFGNGRWVSRFPSEYYVRTCSRDLLEATVRARLRQNPRVHFLERHDAIGLLGSDDGRRVVGLQVQSRTGDQERGPIYPLHAALVVDASGRDSRAPQWLEALGYTPPLETIINSFLAYTSRWYRRSGRDIDVPSALVLNGRAPAEPRGGVLFPVEGDRWIVTLGGIGGVVPPMDEAGFLAFARALPQPDIYEIIKDAEPLTPIKGYRRTENRLRHYEQLARMPDGLVLIGDAVCAFNPVYGQGMAVGAMGAEALDEALRDHRQQHQAGDLSGFSLRFQHRLAKVNATPWLLATGADLSWPTTVGGQPRRTDRLAQHYIERVLRLMVDDHNAYRAFLEVTHLVRSPVALFGPRIMWGVLRQALHPAVVSDHAEVIADSQ